MARRYLLDTHICIYITKNAPIAVRQRLEQHAASELAMSVITLGELRFGAEKSRSRDLALAAIDQLARQIAICDLPRDAASHYGEIRAALQLSGRPIGGNDLWLAAHARADGLIMVTNNVSEFRRVPGLKVENWAETS
ncbi:MAG: type II toxin-antitoxin system VapC family toxin [Comamonadaceae bacterium]|nr:MAG: type II toxin-antitoxin system VapC family toxin [Comamonadaceae bacterium]